VEPEQVGQLRAVGGVLVDAQLEVLGELLVELLVVLGVVSDLRDHLDALLGDVLLDDLEQLVVLEVLSRDVQREILRVDDSLHEAEVLRDELIAVVHDEDSLDVELDVVFLLLVLEEVERGSLGDEEKSLELDLSFDGELLDGEVVFPVVGEGLVEGRVLLLGDVLWLSGPDGLDLVETSNSWETSLTVLVFFSFFSSLSSLISSSFFSSSFFFSFSSSSSSVISLSLVFSTNSSIGKLMNSECFLTRSLMLFSSRNSLLSLFRYEDDLGASLDVLVALFLEMVKVPPASDSHLHLLESLRRSWRSPRPSRPPGSRVETDSELADHRDIGA
jgi:hypothetical protein